MLKPVRPTKTIKWPKRFADPDALTIQRHWESKGYKVNFVVPKPRDKAE